MGKINYVRLLLAAVAASLAFIFTEFVVEGLASVVFKVEESALWVERFGSYRGGIGFHVINLLVLLAISLLLMWLYVALRSHFGPHPRTALIAALFLWLFVLVLWVNFVNLGVFPIEIAALSLGFNLLELPAGALAGAAVYKDRQSSTAA